MPWKVKTTMSQKQEFIIKALEKKQTFSSLCLEFNISRTLGYEIIKKFQTEGIKGLEPISRAPRSRPNKTAKIIEDKIVAVRLTYPTWGPRKIRAYLKKKKETQLPAVSTIGDILKRYGYISEEASLKRQELIRFERSKPNELWQMDFKGHFQLAIRETCYPLTILDDHSRFSICLQACKNEKDSSVRNPLIHIFEQYGIPDQINVDNGTPWGNSSLTKHTSLTVWLMRLGIRVTHSRPHHPQTNGKNERLHRTLKEDLLMNRSIHDFKQAQQLFDQWRHIYNFERPHEGIAFQVPADRYQPSGRPVPSALIPIEYPSQAFVKKIKENGRFIFNKNEYHVGRAFEGYYVEIRPDELRGVIEVYFGDHKIYTHEWKKNY